MYYGMYVNVFNHQYTCQTREKCLIYSKDEEENIIRNFPQLCNHYKSLGVYVRVYRDLGNV